MSKATNQTVILLAVLSGSFKTIARAENCPASVQGTVLWAMEEATQITINFPETGKGEKNLDWMMVRLRQWQECVDNMDLDMEYQTLLYVCNHVIYDLSNKISNPAKLRMIQPLREAIDNMITITDPTGKQFEAMEEADKLLGKLYKLIEFSK